mmetsp:Transcript_48307/g.71603  ORF Transcript_48307/g.71603 Transcript_48307/m.71603 type:complete len:226 (+) Transcript_48307:366-1043(+)
MVGKKERRKSRTLMGIEGQEKDTTDVYVSRMNADDNLSGGEEIIDVEMTKEKPKFEEKTDYDVVVVGSGCAGIGTALMLTRTFGHDTSRVLVLEQGKKVGDSFRNWPEEMRFISPSFNQQGWIDSFDLNAIHYDTSPAFMLRFECPSGEEYAIYLEAIAQQGKLEVSLETEVKKIQEKGKEGKNNDEYPCPFQVEYRISRSGDTRTGKLSTRYFATEVGGVPVSA